MKNAGRVIGEECDMKIPYSFWPWLFDIIADSQNYNSRYGHSNSQAEYGISIGDFLQEQESDAIKDAKEYFERCSREEKESFKKRWHLHLQNQINRYKNLLQEPFEL